MNSDAYIDGVCGINIKNRAVIDVHQGAYHIQYYNVYAENAVSMTPRSRHILVDGFEITGGCSVESDNCLSILPRQRPYNLVVRNGYVHDRTTDVHIFDIGLRDDNDSFYGNEWFDRLLFEDIEIEDIGVPITEIGEFTGSLEGESLTFRNITYDGQQLERSHVTSWPGYDNVTINNLTVE